MPTKSLMENKKYSLYKYRKINDNTIESICHHYLYFNEVQEFNDPFDCIIKSRYRGTKEEFRKYFKRHLPNNDMSSDELKKKIDEMRRKKYYDLESKKELMSELRVCCLTDRPVDILMWSHYADCHKGVCLEYDFERFELDGKCRYKIETDSNQVCYNQNSDVLYAKDVEYADRLPKSFNPILDDPREMLNFLYIKNKSWSYENEKRIVLREAYIRDKRVMLKKGAIKGVYFGLQTDERDICRIMSIYSGNEKPSFYRAVLSNDADYKIGFKKL